MSELKLLVAITILSFVIGLIMGPILIPILHKLKFGQTERLDGPKSHLKKAGTPTMGGIIFIVSVTISALIFIPVSGDKLVLLLATLGFACIGLADDYIKVVMKRSLGLKARAKLIFQFIIAGALTYYAYTNPSIGTTLYVPFTHSKIDLGVWFIPFTIFVIVGTINSFNFADGIDGLAAGMTFIVSTFFSLVTLNMQLPVSLFAGSITGTTLSFLRFNSYPAKVIMGDTGSFLLGGAIATIAVLSRLQLFLPIACGVFLIETLSIIIQVVSFRLTGKRVFKMAPIHHHFELCGWHETKVVKVFWSATLILVIISYLSLL